MINSANTNVIEELLLNKEDELEYWEDRLWTEAEEEEVYQEFRKKIIENSEKINEYDVLGLSNILQHINQYKGLTKCDIWLYERFLSQAESEIQNTYLNAKNDGFDEIEDFKLDFLDKINKAQQKLAKIKFYDSFYHIKDIKSHSTPYYKKEEDQDPIEVKLKFKIKI